MPRRLQHIILILLLIHTQALGQIAMPDTVCVGTTRQYQVNDAATPSTYTWSVNGNVQSSTANRVSIAWNTPGVFQLSVLEHNAAGCDGDIRSGLVYVMPPPVANAGADAIVCFGNSIRLNGSGGTSYQWSPANYLSNAAIANPVVSIPFAGTYRYVLNVSANGCKSPTADTVEVTVLTKPEIFAGNDTTIAVNEPLQLHAQDVSHSNFSTFIWSPATGLNNPTLQNPVATRPQPQTFTYHVTATTPEGCIAKDDISIRVFNQAEIYVPTAFTPNNDGRNDLFKPVLVGIRELKYFSVYNRFGQLVYTASKDAAGWDGTVNGIKQGTGAYVWMAEATDYKGNVLNRKGTVVLIR